MFGGTPTNFVYGFKKKIGGGVVMPKYFIDLKKCWGGYAAVCQNILGNWKKCWWGGGGYAQIFYRLEKCWGGGYANKFMDLKNVGEVMPKYFRDLKKNVGGGEGHNCQFWSCSLILSTF